MTPEHGPKLSFSYLRRATFNQLPTRDSYQHLEITQDTSLVLHSSSPHLYNIFTNFIWQLCRLKSGIADDHIDSMIWKRI